MATRTPVKAKAKAKATKAAPRPKATRKAPAKPVKVASKAGKAKVVAKSTPAKAAPKPLPAKAAPAAPRTPAVAAPSRAPSPPAVPVRVLPAAPAGELAADLPIGRLLEYGAVFGKGRVAVQHQPTPLPLPSGRVALGDVDGARHELARQLPPGTYRWFAVRRGDGPAAPPVAVGMYCGRPPIARWVHAHRAGKKPPRSAAEVAPVELQRLVLADAGGGSSVGLDDQGAASARPYWGLGPDGAPVCLVVELGVLTAGEWKTARPR